MILKADCRRSRRVCAFLSLIRSTFLWLGCGLLCTLAIGPRLTLADYVTIGNGAGSKWDERTHGFPATITWGFMPDGTTITPAEPFSEVVIGGSKMSLMRSNFDTQFGAGGIQYRDSKRTEHLASRRQYPIRRSD